MGEYRIPFWGETKINCDFEQLQAWKKRQDDQRSKPFEVTLMSNEERPAGCFGYIGYEILPSYVGIFLVLNHYNKDLVIKQPLFHGKYPAISFFRGSYDLPRQKLVAELQLCDVANQDSQVAMCFLAKNSTLLVGEEMGSTGIYQRSVEENVFVARLLASCDIIKVWIKSVATQIIF